MNWTRIRKYWPWLLVLAIAAGAAAASPWLRSLGSRDDSATVASFDSVERRDLEQTVEATGTVEPIVVVEIKSKASGEIKKMPVEVGSVVRAGDLLAQIDPLNVQNQYDQARAALAAAQAGARVAQTALTRSDTLFARELVAAEAHEAAVLTRANALSSLAKAKSDLEIARQALADATVRAPSGGTILQQDVTVGQVIASATSSVTGGTTLLKMADLRQVRMRALVSETDIGNMRAGMSVSVTVDAFPNRKFTGKLMKIEPQAVVTQSVTQFPAIVSISNERGELLPGMNGEVSISIASRRQALVVPIEAVRTQREMASTASALGLDGEAVAASVRRQLASAGADTRGVTASATSSSADPGPPDGGPPPDGAGSPAAGAGSAITVAAKRATTGDTSDRRIVFVRTNAGALEPRVVRIGISDYDGAEVLSGLEEGDAVALLGVVEASATRANQKAQIEQRMGSMPGGITTTRSSRTATTGAK